MKLFRILIKLVAFIFFLFKTRHAKSAWLFAHYNLPLVKGELFHVANGRLLLKATDNSVPLTILPQFKHGLVPLLNILNDTRFQAQDSPSYSFVINVDKVCYPVRSLNNLNIIHELYIEKLYNIQSSHQNIIMLDIGMNVGFASLFFASNNNISHVYGYEPFTATFSEAAQNIQSNPGLQRKVTPNNYGVSNISATVNVPMLEGGSVVASVNTSFIEEHNIHSENTTTVEVKSITEIISDVIKRHPGSRLYLKIDCEGEEYNILESLNKSGIPGEIAGFIIEWHFRGSGPLVHILNNHRYTVFDTAIHDEAIYGMLYAFKD